MTDTEAKAAMLAKLEADDKAKAHALKEEETIQELFDRDPLNLSSQDIELIVFKLQQERQRWALEEAAGKKKRPAKTNGKPDPRAQNLTLESLNLSLDL